MSRTLYVEPDQVSGNQISISAEEAFHASKVLRAKPGDEFRIVDGEGTEFLVKLISLSREEGLAEIVTSRKNVGELNFKLDLAIAPIKSRDRWEFAVEKATELGVSNIIPLITSRTEKVRLNVDRLEKKVISALKQSGRSLRPRISDITDFEKLLSLSESYDCSFLCCAFDDPPALFDFRVEISESKKLLVCIGPEGGFSELEVDRARESGMRIAGLGSRRLRTETAAVSALSIIGQLA